MSKDERRLRGRELAQGYFDENVPDAWREISTDLAELTESAAFEAVRTRPALEQGNRAVLAVGMNAALGALTQLAWHARGAPHGHDAGGDPGTVIQAVGFAAGGNAMRTIVPILEAHNRR